MKLEYMKWYFNEPYLPRWMFHAKYIFDRMSWQPGVWPSFPKYIADVWENICVRLTPWMKWWRSLLLAFVNANGTKVICCDRKMGYVRTRNEEVVYYRLKRRFLRATLYREYLVDKSGDKKNAFVTAILVGLCGQGNPDDYKEVVEKVLSGPCLTHGQCQRLLDRIVAVTADMEWITP